MSFFKYFKESFARKKARRVFQEYDYRIDTFHLEKEGDVQFANWNNPLVGAHTVLQDEVDFYKMGIPKGSLAIDVGGNIGDTTVAIGLAAGKEGLVIALDPNPVVYKILAANAGLNKDKTNIVTLPYAASDKEEEFFYASSEASFSNGGLISDKKSKRLGKHTYQQKVKSINLEKYLVDHHADKLPLLSLIKVDTEGFDLIVLKSLSNLIDTYHPNLVAECFFSIPDEEKLALYDFVASKGYTIYNLHHFVDYDPKNLKIIAREEMLNAENFNIYAVKK
jgi:FkbM family methyltransferase